MNGNAQNSDAPPTQELWDIYIDESSQTKNRYLVLGAILLPAMSVTPSDMTLSVARLPELPHGEIKWGKVSKAKFAAYQRYVDCFFDDPALSAAKFHSLIVDTTQLNHKRFNSGSREIGFNKELYNLATKCARLQKSGLFHLYPDYRDTNQRPDDLKNILNHGRHKKGDNRDWPFRRCQFRDSSKTPLLQLVDLLLGALAYGINKHYEQENASPHKLELARYILRRAGIRDLHQDTSIDGKYTIWHRKLRQASPEVRS
ncbi:DUF3800 domain-containing protein [Sphingomonas sp. CFBP8993]|uniref:DUF3800 domain-containing protein n=1 Tax=Sphingomonas sp. CFBP8993 TaxID=3096526 RepID=UPI002A6B5200|nr:DUF3800 domain-containing protein [Sphingomonas sp. CFBP8993]MDY0959493.1 DUF3800 domain-containing protein [Sphingomonas sp. CFBP8993]